MIKVDLEKFLGSSLSMRDTLQVLQTIRSKICSDICNMYFYETAFPEDMPKPNKSFEHLFEINNQIESFSKILDAQTFIDRLIAAKAAKTSKGSL
jgi:hypothetical protein